MTSGLIADVVTVSFLMEGKNYMAYLLQNLKHTS